MRIMSLHTFGDTQSGGGAERVMETLMLGLQARGHEVSIAATSAEPGVTSFMQGGIKHWRAGLKNLYWPRLDRRQPWIKRRLWHLLDIYNPFMKRPLREILNAERPDVVFVHNLTGWSVSALDTIKARGIPIVQILHDHYYICSNSAMFKGGRNCQAQCSVCRLMRAPHRRLSDRVDAVVGVSRYILERHLACGAFTGVKVREVIHNVVSPEALGVAEAPALRAAAQASRVPGRVRFGYIGAIAPHKGVDLLLQVFSTWNRQDVELWVAGVGQTMYMNGLTKCFESDRIRFLGRKDPKNFFTSIDVTVVPSKWQENFPTVILESLAFGVPVIASSRGGIIEIAQKSNNVILFDPDRNESLMAHLDSFVTKLSEDKLTNSLVRGSVHDVNDNDDWVSSYVKLITLIHPIRL